MLTFKRISYFDGKIWPEQCPDLNNYSDTYTSVFGNSIVTTRPIGMPKSVLQMFECKHVVGRHNVEIEIGSSLNVVKILWDKNDPFLANQISYFYMSNNRISMRVSKPGIIEQVASVCFGNQSDTNCHLPPNVAADQLWVHALLDY